MITDNAPLVADAAQTLSNLKAQIATVIKGKNDQIQFVLTALLAGGHILMEDNPGTGKTILARTLAACISSPLATAESALFKRVQFTPDLLPMDLLGTHIYDDQRKEFIFKKGPLFCNILLADEINRASPKVQSALLECMAENQITMGEVTYKLDDLFFTIATQNPVEMEGTYPLPAAQLDRFYMKIFFGYVEEETELEIYKSYRTINQNLQELHQQISLQQLLKFRKVAEEIFIHDELIKAVSNLVRNTRQHPDISLGASTRSGIYFIKCLKAFALLQGRPLVIEDDVIQLAKPVLDHRLVYRHQEGKQQALINLIQQESERLQRLRLFS